MDGESTISGGGRSVITLEQALARPINEAYLAFARHVNPVEAKLLRLGNFAKLYARAQGLYFYDARGRRYMDFTAGFGALNLGHNPPEVLAAVRKAQSLPTVLLAGFSPLAGALAEALAGILPGELSVACFGNGGAEAVELALKTARAATGRTRFVSCANAYHGLSFGAMSVSGSGRYRAIFGPLVEHCETVPFGDVAALLPHLANEDVAAFIVEPLQGEGGAVVPPEGYLKAVAEVCHAYGTLLIVDEIQTGFGRTGRLFAIEHDGAVPDIVLLSKSLGAGVVPISVCCTTGEIWERAFGRRDRFDLIISTFGGNAAACAASLKAIEITLRDDLAGRAARLGQHAMARLQELADKHETVKAIHGRGLLLGIEVTPPISGATMDESFALMIASCLLNDHGVLTTYFDLAPRILRFEPPLIVSKEEIDYAIDAFDHVLGLGVGGLALSIGRNAIERVLHHTG
ncbi:MAG TPA: aspartate aminotransferase family protein [Thermoanaerobaculia bacterium]|nr:aspartate aminotransferase family protein [Thermoanaerobaculia bacterium]